MIFIDPKSQSRKENYQILSSAVIPRPIAFVTSQNEEGVVNAAPFSFFNVITAEPPLISISVGRRNGETVKDTGRNILKGKEFVVHLVDEAIVDQMNQTSAEYPSNVSEVKETGLTLTESKVVRVPSIKEAKIRMECSLHQAIALGTEEEASCDLLIGEVVMFHLADDIFADGKVSANASQLVSRLGGAEYARLTDVFSLQRPVK
ncbi:flavin reductase family protein [Alkalihalobacterium elongatum]|uniref:flavin reductase family protein n=1 Tax=Alkalihalobacterium elongatum TaxID=2675466 RepID=UPI001C1FC732|nr:flavin reductase family protein [Alkalihalobacterium elongatum]